MFNDKLDALVWSISDKYGIPVTRNQVTMTLALLVLTLVLVVVMVNNNRTTVKIERNVPDDVRNMTAPDPRVVR